MHVNTDFLIQYLRIQEQPFKGLLLHWCFTRDLLGSYSIYSLFGYSCEFQTLFQTPIVKAFSMWKPVSSDNIFYVSQL